MNNNKLPRLDNRSKEELICNILLNYAFKNNNDNILDTIISTLNLGEEIYMSDFALYINNNLIVFNMMEDIGIIRKK